MQKPQDIAWTGTNRITLLPRLGLIRSLPFLAQCLAQEIIASDETLAAHWRAGNAAYRLARRKPRRRHGSSFSRPESL